MVKGLAVHLSLSVPVEDTPVLPQDDAPLRRLGQGFALPDAGQLLDRRLAFLRGQLLELLKDRAEPLRRHGVVTAVGAEGVPSDEAAGDDFAAGSQDLAEAPAGMGQGD